MARKRSSPRSTARAALAPVVSLDAERLSRRLEGYRRRLLAVLARNKAMVGSLHASGTLFTRAGTRAGRDLLLAHENLLRVLSLLDTLCEERDLPGPRKPEEVNRILGELDAVLDRTGSLTEATARLLT